ncbi:MULTISPECIES: alpha/beta fold hydrolase [unclassified Crossiella]|uniref:alpha/beta fold hydrolase n=1 Tax=unclassified Crossiella TaxID=2620835 RepID=UPI001FFE9198|nr:MULTISPECIES: alpha/beta hydrolase [unclassified Crossiella]MCK2244738.1 alpha/beta hydrolase [Crossiella sp. S99.2]MCK2258264.1 alpha/beta hydrolase [Crossiella sp. S99.1]
MIESTYPAADGRPLFFTTLGTGPLLVLLHGGGPDHRSLLPLADHLADQHTVALPDIRGYGRSHCPDPAQHTWNRYTEDVLALLDHLGAQRAAVGGTGLGSTISLRTALRHPDRVAATVLISVEDIEDDAGKAAEAEFLAAFAERVRTSGIEAGWAPILPQLAPLIGELVREAMPRADPASVAAAAAIGADRAFSGVDELAGMAVPTLIFPGTDHRHPPAVARELLGRLPNGRLASGGLTAELRSAAELADAVGPAVREFLGEFHRSA